MKKDITRGQINLYSEGVFIRRAWASGKIGGISVNASARKFPFRRARYSVLVDNIDAREKRDRVLKAKGELQEVLSNLPGDDFTEVVAKVLNQLADLVWDKVKPGDTIKVQNAKGKLRFLAYESRDDELNG